ncbi:hypothetical protein DFP73DRAFT_545647 [Morchella snyderi]|nr:hypothetical protein DFP73DRAFT_545647 [Morchella snyderi]
MTRISDKPHYASLPGEDELVLVTSVLGASASWLAHAFLKEALTAGERAVVFVSFTRDLGFHGECLRKLGIDLTAYGAKGRFAFVDGLSNLFFPSTPGPSRAAAGALSATGGIKGIMNGISQAVRRLTTGSGKPLLILENPEFLSAALESVGVVEMGDVVMELREISYGVIVMVGADSAFLQEPKTRLEIDHAAFVISLSHCAAWTVGLRLLDTGIAKDVSGVIRVTRGVGDTSAEEKEVLYYVGDGTVEVFDRGQVRG